jgi:hypothetical protein
MAHVAQVYKSQAVAWLFAMVSENSVSENSVSENSVPEKIVLGSGTCLKSVAEGIYSVCFGHLC